MQPQAQKLICETRPTSQIKGKAEYPWREGNALYLVGSEGCAVLWAAKTGWNHQWRTLPNTINPFEESNSRNFSKSNMADRNCKIPSGLHETRYLEVLWVADFKLEVKLQLFKIADPIWWTEIAKYNFICIQLRIWKFFGSLISNYESNFENWRWLIVFLFFSLIGLCYSMVDLPLKKSSLLVVCKLLEKKLVTKGLIYESLFKLILILFFNFTTYTDYF